MKAFQLYCIPFILFFFFRFIFLPDFSNNNRALPPIHPHVTIAQQLQTKGDTKMEISFILCAIYLLLGMALIAMCFNLMQVSLDVKTIFLCIFSLSKAFASSSSRAKLSFDKVLSGKCKVYWRKMSLLVKAWWTKAQVNSMIFKNFEPISCMAC